MEKGWRYLQALKLYFYTLLKHLKRRKRQVLKRGLDQIGSKEFEKIEISKLFMMPKPHKLDGEINKHSESKLKGRPIVCGYSSIIVQPTRLLQREVNYIIGGLKMEIKRGFGLVTLVGSTSEYVQLLHDIDVKTVDQYVCISCDFSDIFTSLERGDLENALMFSCRLLGATTEYSSYLTELNSSILQHNFFENA